MMGIASWGNGDTLTIHGQGHFVIRLNRDNIAYFVRDTNVITLALISGLTFSVGATGGCDIRLESTYEVQAMANDIESFLSL